MAYSSNKATILLNTALLISLILVVAMTDARSISPGGKVKAAAQVTCDLAIGVEKDDTCSHLAFIFNMSLDDFNAINPNVNCDDLFIGQWVCVQGS